MVLPMITGTHPVSARIHSGKYTMMENSHWLLSINGKYAGSISDRLAVRRSRLTGGNVGDSCLGNAYGKRSPCDLPL